MDGFQKQPIHKLKPAGQFPGNVHDQERKQADVLVVQLVQGTPG